MYSQILVTFRVIPVQVRKFPVNYPVNIKINPVKIRINPVKIRILLVIRSQLFGWM